jgi:ABC-type branched-subunit amino acid transport system substrate-binding protein
MNQKHRVVASVATAMCAVSLAACSSSSHNSAGAGTTSATTSGSGSSSKAPVTVMMLSQITGADFGSPETVPVAQAFVQKWNANGGLAGHQVTLVTCDDKESPNTNAQCARTAVADHAVAVVEGVSISDTGGFPILQAAGIPDFNSPTVPAQNTDSNSFPVTGGDAADYGGVGLLLAGKGCSKIAVIADSSAPAQAAGHQEAAGVTSQGGKLTFFQTVSSSTADYTSVVDAALGSGANCLGLTTAPTESVKALTALHQSTNPNILTGTLEAGFPPVLASQLGALAKGLIVSSGYYLPSDSQASDFNSLVSGTSVGAKGESGFAENVYAGFETLQAIGKTMSGSVTAATVLAAANKASDLTVSLLPKPLSYTTPNPVSGYERLTNMWILGYEWSGTTYAPLQGSAGLVNAQPALEAYAK